MYKQIIHMFPETTSAKVYREEGVIYAATPLVGVKMVKGPAQAWKKIHKAGGQIVADSYAEWVSWFGPDESTMIGGGSRLVLK